MPTAVREAPVSSTLNEIKDSANASKSGSVSVAVTDPAKFTSSISSNGSATATTYSVPLTIPKQKLDTVKETASLIPTGTQVAGVASIIAATRPIEATEAPTSSKITTQSPAQAFLEKREVQLRNSTNHQEGISSPLTGSSRLHFPSTISKRLETVGHQHQGRMVVAPASSIVSTSAYPISSIFKIIESAKAGVNPANLTEDPVALIEPTQVTHDETHHSILSVQAGEEVSEAANLANSSKLTSRYITFIIIVNVHIFYIYIYIYRNHCRSFGLLFSWP